MTEYKIVRGNIIVNGVVRPLGTIVKLSDKQAKILARHVEMYNNADQPKRKEDETVDYNELTISELEKKASKLDIEIEGTGKGGRKIKKDYVVALENHKE